MTTRALFLHGGPGYADYLEDFFAGQFSHNLDCIFYSQSQAMGVTVEDLIEEVGHHVAPDGSTILIGHSWGGALAIEYFRRTKDPRINKIVLLSSFLCGADVTTEYQKELSNLGLVKPTREQVFLTADEIPEASNLITRLNATFNHRVFQSVWEKFIPTYDARSFVRSLQIPILNIFGEKDVRVPARQVRGYAAMNSKIENLEIAGAGHFPFIRRSDRATVIEAIQRFVDSTSA